MLNIVPSNRFKKDLKLAAKRGCSIQLLSQVIQTLANELPLPEKNKDHALTGNYKSYRECHIEPDWLLIYQIRNDDLILFLARTGSHSDLF